MHPRGPAFDPPQRMSVTRSTEFLRRSKAEILAEERRVRATRVDLVTGAEVTKARVMGCE